MVNHHPSTDFLMEYSAGTLPVAQSACISAHINYCDKCRRSHEQFQNIGGTLFDTLEPVAISDALLDRVLAQLDDPAPLTFGNGCEKKELPNLLQRIINGDFSQLVWKRITKSLSVSYLSTGDTDYEFALFRIAAGGRIPEHRHGGSEMTLVLEGGFSDGQGSYHPGDFVFRTPEDAHAPVALDGEPCICLAVTDAPLKFTRWHYRWMNPFLQLHAS